MATKWKLVILIGFVAIASAVALSYFNNEVLNNNAPDDISNEILVLFEKSVPMDEARKVMESYGTEILYSSQYFKYFHVRMSDSNRAQQLIASLEHNNMVSCVVPNQYLVPCSANVFILDDYDDPDLRFVQDETGKYYYDGDGDGSVIIVDEDDKEHNCYIEGKQICMTHGDMVEQTLKMNNNDIVVDRYDHGDSLKGVIEILDNICENKKMSDDNLNIINMSFSTGAKFSKDTPKRYKNAYIEFVKTIVDAASKFDNNNFVITIGMGNQYMHNMEYIFEDMKKKLTPKQLQTIKNNIVFVEAKDERPQHRPLGYSNTISRKVEDINVIQVDLSDLPAFQGGTSAAAPLVANWILKNGFKKADDVIKAFNRATEDGNLVSESEFETISKQVKFSDYGLVSCRLIYSDKRYSNAYDSYVYKKVEILNTINEDVRVKGYIIDTRPRPMQNNTYREFFDVVVPGLQTIYVEAYSDDFDKYHIESVAKHIYSGYSNYREREDILYHLTYSDSYPYTLKKIEFHNIGNNDVLARGEIEVVYDGGTWCSATFTTPITSHRIFTFDSNGGDIDTWIDSWRVSIE